MKTIDQKQSAATAFAHECWVRECRRDWLLAMLWKTATHNHTGVKCEWPGVKKPVHAEWWKRLLISTPRINESKSQFFRRFFCLQQNRFLGLFKRRQVGNSVAMLRWQNLNISITDNEIEGRYNAAAVLAQELAAGLREGFLNGDDSIATLFVPDVYHPRGRSLGTYAGIALQDSDWRPRRSDYESPSQVIAYIEEMQSDRSKSPPDVLIAGERLYEACARACNMKDQPHFYAFGVDIVKEPMIPKGEGYAFPWSSVELCFLTAPKKTVSLNFTPHDSDVMTSADLYYAIRFKKPSDFTKFVPRGKSKE